MSSISALNPAFNSNMKTKEQKKHSYITNEINRWAFKDITDNFNYSVSDLQIVNEKQDEVVALTETNVNENENQDAQNDENLNSKGKKMDEKKKKPKQFKLNSAAGVALPGANQKNTTIDRTFLKDLVRLSQQRHIQMLSHDFQKRTFINRQAIKGIFPTDTRIQSNMSRNTPTRADTAMSLRRSESVMDGRRSSFLERRRSILSPSMRLNMELARIHEKEIEERNSGRISHEQYLKNLLNPILPSESPEIGTIQEVAIINDPMKLDNSELKIVEQPVEKLPALKAKSVRVIDTPFHDEDYFGRETRMQSMNPLTDSRYQNLLVSMTNIYRTPKVRPESPDERVNKLIRSNTAFIRKGDSSYTYFSDQSKKRQSFEKNFELFEKTISNVM